MLTEFARSWPNFHRNLPEAVRRWPSVNLWPLSLHPINQSHDDAKCLGASFFFLLFLRQNHTVSSSKRILSLFFLSLSLFLVNLQEENRQTVGIDGFEVIFVGSDPSEARWVTRNTSRWNFSSFSLFLPRLPRRSTSVLPISREPAA